MIRSRRHSVLRGMVVAVSIAAFTAVSNHVDGGDERLHDIVILGGTVVDPETGLEAVRNIGIDGDKIARMPDTSAREGFQEGIEVSAVTNGVNLLAHINSTAHRAIDDVFPLIEQARAAGIPVVPEVYPWTAGSTTVKVDFLDPANLPLLGIPPSNIRPVADLGRRGETFGGSDLAAGGRRRP